ncbi:uncharacterized protein [Palaemon carinicauda]|uniref:uncharacterized protein isoform X2 n=1 Tax=Palaemon carinicauda TaxID=392227 RepID=UPI0035B594EA
MHIPLYLSCDVLSKTKRPWSNVRWIGQETGTVYSFKNGYVDQIQLQTSSSHGISKFNKIAKNASVINTTFQGTIVFGILLSGDLFFWDYSTNKASYVKGLPELVSHLPQANVEEQSGPFHSILDKFKQSHHEEHDVVELQERGEQSVKCDVPLHQRPKIFASDDCSKVIVVVGACQVFVWSKDLANSNEHQELLCGVWSVAACPSDVLLPCQASRETEISSCFCNQAPGGEQCLITFSFFDDSSLLNTTLSLRWRPTDCSILSASWYTVHTAFRSMGIREQEVVKEKGSLISRYANNQSFLCIALNSPLRYSSRLVYLHPFSETIATENIEKSSSNFGLRQVQDGDENWVADMAWSWDNSYIAGCLRTGSIFMATRMGPLIRISCTGENLDLQPSSLLRLHPHSYPRRIMNMKDEESSKKYSIIEQDFSVNFHPYCNKFLFSSGHRISVLSLPENCSRDAEVVEQLIQNALHALHSVRNSSVTHDYAYIRSSTWRLAQSLPNLYQSCENVSKTKNCEMNLWGKEEMKESQNRVKVLPDEEEWLIEDIIKHLMGAWTFILTHDKPHTQEWMMRIKRVSKILVNFISTMLQTTMDDDRHVHQAQIVHMLNIFHRFVSLLCVWPSSLHMVKTTLSLCHRVIHTILKCEKHGNERYMVDTVLVLTQTVSSVEKQLASVYNFQPVMDSRCDFYGVLQGSASCTVTNVKVLAIGTEKDSYVPVINHRLKTIWKCLYCSIKKIYIRIQKKYVKTTYQKCVAVLNLVQRSLQELECDISFPKLKVKQGNNLCINGLYYSAIKAWKTDVDIYIAQGSCKKNISRRLHSILYAYIFLKDYRGLALFVEWLSSLVTSGSAQNDISSSRASHLLSTKGVNNERTLFCEPRNSTSHKVEDQKESSGDIPQKETKNPMELPQAKEEQVKNIQSKSYRNVIQAVRMLIGSFGRILARMFMKKDVFVPLPHKPHRILPLWLDNTRAEDSGMVLCSSSYLKEAIQGSHWTVEIAAQALCFSGNWEDLVVFAQELGDKRIALLSSIVVSSIESSRATLPTSFFPEAIIKELMLKLWGTRKLDVSLFQCYQDLLKVAAMTQVKILPDILAICLLNIRKIIQELPLIVPNEIYLPAPPVFCPQLLPNEKLTGDGELRKCEDFFRKILARWVRLFAVMISASGIAHHLLTGWCTHFDCNEDLGSDIYFQEIIKLSDTLKVRKGSVPQGPEWARIFQLWQELLYHLWLLHCRDKLSLLLRKFSEFPQFYSKNERKLSIQKEILMWTIEINKQTQSSIWKEQTVGLALTSASNIPPCVDVTKALARIVPDPAKLPSLLKDKAKRLFDTWKNTNIKSEGTLDAYPDFFSLFEKFCEEEKILLGRNGKSQRVHNGDQENEKCFVAHNFQETGAGMEREYRKLVSLYASMNFAKDAEAFPQHQVQIPSLSEFTNEIAQFEFEGLEIRKQLFDSIISVEECKPVRSLSKFRGTMCLDDVHGAHVERRGLFRNLAFSHIWQDSTNTKLYISRSENLNTTLHRVSRNISRRTQSLSPLVKKGNGQHGSIRERENVSKSPLIEGTLHSSERRMAKHHHSLGRTSLHSTHKHHRSKSLHVTRKEKESKVLDLKNKSLLSSQANLADHLKQLLSSIKSFGASKMNEVSHEDIQFIYWMMSSERVFLCSPLRGDIRSSTVSMKINLQIEDIFCALMWFNFPFTLSSNSFIEATSSHKENEDESHVISVTEQHVEGNPPRKKKTRKKHSSKKKREVLNFSAINEDQQSTSELVLQGVTTDGNEKHGKENPTNICRADEVSNIGDDEMLHHELKIDKTDGTSAFASMKVRDKKHLEVHHFGVEKESKSLANRDEVHSDDGVLSSEGHSSVINVPEKGPSGLTRDSHRYPSLDNSQIILEKLKGMKVELTVPEELRNLVQAQQDGIEAMISAADKFKETFEKNHQRVESCDAGNQTVDSSKSTLSNTKKETKKNNSPNGRHVSNLEQKPSHELSLEKKTAPKGESVIGSKHKNSWKPFHLKSDGSVRPPKLVIEVHEAVKRQDHENPDNTPPVILKKKSLTPVETTSEAQEFNHFGVTKLLQIPPENKTDSEKLTLSALDEDEESMSDLHEYLPVDDTLDDITSPDSLHASDLEEGSVMESTSQRALHEKILRKNVMINDNALRIRNNVSKAINLNSKDSVVLKVSEIKPRQYQWDERVHLKQVPLKFKPSLDQNISKASGILSGNQMNDGNLTKRDNYQAPLKLLVLPKQDSQSGAKENPKAFKPLTLKKIPFAMPQYSLGNLNKVKFPIRNEAKHAKGTFEPTHVGSDVLALREQKLQKLTLLKLPSSATKVQGKNMTETTFKFLHPSDVFSFYSRHMENRDRNKFRTLKVTEGNFRRLDSVHREGGINKSSMPREIPEEMRLVNHEGLYHTRGPSHGDSSPVVEKPLSQERQFDFDTPISQKVLIGDKIPSPHEDSSLVEVPSPLKKPSIEVCSPQKKTSYAEISAPQRRPSSAEISAPQRRPSSAEISAPQRRPSSAEISAPQRRPSSAEGSSLQRRSFAAGVLSSHKEKMASDKHSFLEISQPREIPLKIEVPPNQERSGPGVMLQEERSLASEIYPSHDDLTMNEPKAVHKVLGGHDFLDKIHDYEKKYEVGMYKDVLEESKFMTKEKETTPGFQYEAAKQMAELYKLQKQHFQGTKETQTEAVCGSNNNSEGLAKAKPAGETTSSGIYAEQTDSVADNDRKISPRNHCMDSEMKIVKDSWTETDNAADILTKNTEIQTQSKTTADASVTACMSPPTSSSVAPHVTVSFDPAGLIADPYSHPTFPASLDGSVAHVVDIPRDVVQRHLTAIGDDLNRTIPSILPNEPLDNSSSSRYQEYDMRQSHALTHLEEKPENKDNRTLQDFVIDDENRRFEHESMSSSSLELGIQKEAEIGNRESIRNVESHGGECTPERSVQMPFSQVSQEIDGGVHWIGDFTMENLTQAFMDGKLSFEKYYELSNNAIETDDMLDKKRKANDDELHIEAIEELEKEAEAAVLGLQTSKKLLARLEVVMQESQRMEAEEFLGRQRGSYSSSKSRLHEASVKQEWQKVQSEFGNSLDTDRLLRFIENVNPEDISDEMIDTIMEYTEIAEGIHGVKDYSSPNEKKTERVCDKQTVSQRNQGTRSEVHLTDFGTNFDRPVFVDEIHNLIHQREDFSYSPNLHIDLRSLRSESSGTFRNMPNQPSSARSNTSSVIERENQRKRAEIRKWMKEKRKERIKKSSELQKKKSGSQLLGQKDSNLQSGQERGITGKEIRSSNREKEERRRQLRIRLQKKLEKDMNELLDDHSQQASSHRDLLHSSPSSLKTKSPQKVYSKPSTYRSMTPWKEDGDKSRRHTTKKSFNETFTSDKKNLTNFNETYTIAKKNRPNFNETFSIGKKNLPSFNETYTLAEKYLAQERNTSAISNFSKLDDPSFHAVSPGISSRKTRLLPSQKNEGEGHKNIEVELNKLTKCIESVDKNRLSKPKIPPAQTDKSVTGFGARPKKLMMHQRASSVSLPLDRISEVDSDTFSSLSAVDEVEKRSGNGSSSDISWSVPAEVKKVLYD